MRFAWFKADFRTPIEECKRQYRKLVMEHHPDRGGNEEDMKAINAEWEWFHKHNYNIHETKEGSVYTDERQEAPDEVTERFAWLINILIAMEGVGIEICGSFIWLSGDTKPYKEVLKALGFRWARKKGMWYIAPTKYRKRRRECSMNEIRDWYGSYKVTQAVKTDENVPLLTA